MTGQKRAKRRKYWIFIPPSALRAPSPASGGKESFASSGVNTGLTKLRYYWVRFKRRKCWIFIPPSALRAPSPASGEGIFRAKRRKCWAHQAAWLRSFAFKRRKGWIFIPPSALRAPSPASGGRNIVPSGVSAGFLSPLPPSGHLPPQAGGRNLSCQAA